MPEGPFVRATLVPLGAQHPGDEALLAPDERARASRFVHERPRRRFTAARAALRRILAAELGVAPEAVAFRYAADGKPDLAARFAASGVRFSLSHSADLAIVAVTRDAEIGVDLERLRDVRYGARVAARFFSAREQAALRAQPVAAWAAAFFRCWTRKEAFVKCLGTGLRYPLARFSVALSAEEPARLLEVADDPEAVRRFTMIDLDAGTGFAAAVCVAAPGAALDGRPLYSGG